MEKKLCIMIFLIGLSTSLFAQKVVSDCITSGNENYCIINISRCNTFQEARGAGKIIQMIYINDQPVCEITCPSRASIKVFSEGKLSLSVKFMPNKKVKQKVIDKQFMSGQTLELDVKHGNTFFVNVDQKLTDGFRIFWVSKLVSIQESEGMFKDEARYKKSPGIEVYQEDNSNPYIKK
jgi:hypothetical protein